MNETGIAAMSATVVIDAMTIATALLNLGFALLVGAMLTRWHTGDHASDWSQHRHRQLRTLIFFSIGMVAVAMIAVLIIETATMADVPLQEALPSVASVLSSTHFGRAWSAGAGCIALLLVLQLLQLRAAAAPSHYLSGAFGLAGFAVSRSAVSHAFSHAVSAGIASWPMAIETAHLLLISVWLGEVIIAGLLMLRTPCGAEVADRTDCARYIAQLSGSAAIVLVGIIATGVANSVRGMGGMDHLGSTLHLFDSTWGVILLAKVAGVIVAVALGAFNRWTVMPDLLRHLPSASPEPESESVLASELISAQHRFARTLQIESAVLLAVLFAAALLSSSAPPASV